MNRKGFTLIEFLGCIALMGIILCIGLYSARGTLSTTLSTLTDVSRKQIYDASRAYIQEYKITWINDGEEYTCIMISELVDAGYFDNNEISSYENNYVKIVRDPHTKVESDIYLLDRCD